MLAKFPTFLVLPLAIIVSPSVVLGQSYPIDELQAPSFTSVPSDDGYFHQVSAPEVLATPIAQSGRFPEQTPVGPSNSYSDLGPRPEPPIPLGNVKPNCCPDVNLQDQCTFDRYFQKPTHLPKEQLDCVVCLKEPYTVEVPVKEQVEVVMYRCFKTKEPFEFAGCEDGTWFHKKGEKALHRMRPCTVKVDLNYTKKVVKYRDVWYHVHCPTTR